MIELLINQGCYVVDKGNLFNELLAREELESTGIGGGIALAHVRTDSHLVPVYCGVFYRENSEVEIPTFLGGQPAFFIMRG